MLKNTCVGVIFVSSLVLLANCGGDDSGSKGTSSSGGSGGSGGTSSGGSSSGGDGGKTSSSGGKTSSSSGGKTSSGGTTSGSGGDTSSGGSSAGSAGQAGGGGEAGSPDEPDHPVACPDEVSGLSEAFAEAVCKKRVECCVDDYDTCLKEVTEAMDSIYEGVAESVDAGTASFECTAFDACAAAIDTAACEDWPYQVGDVGQIPVNEPACRQLVTPTVPADGECTYNYECINGLCASGNCLEYVAENGACNESGAICDFGTMFCNGADRCQKLLANGVVCGDDLECESGLCDTDDTGVCIAPGKDMCEYAPSAPASCSVSNGSPDREGSAWPLGFALAGLGVAVARRRRDRDQRPSGQK